MNFEVLPKDVLNALKNRLNIVGLSGGKDSVATCILLRSMDIPFKTVTAEVWWKENIIGENPKHYEFMHNILFPKLKSWGVECDVVKSKTTAYQYMTTPIIKSKHHPERIGKYRGFPLCGKCGIQRDCKSRVCERYYKQITEPHNVILGLASNEKDRVMGANVRNQIALLDLLGVHEKQTFKICNKEGLLSPTYSFSDRGGCWFCPNQKIQEFEVLYREHPELWNELMEVQKMPNKVTELFNRKQTLYDIEAQIKSGVQMKFFASDFLKGETNG
jgi:3'-phosphoadenosine 5'-phosphosulfate sulfotransferase (PAPS reductase)/FAD synthetase